MKYFISILLLTISVLSFAQRKKISFNSGWRFAFGHANDPEKDFKYSIKNIFAKTGAAPGTAIDPAFNDSNWRSLSLPTTGQ